MNPAVLLSLLSDLQTQVLQLREALSKAQEELALHRKVMAEAQTATKAGTP